MKKSFIEVFIEMLAIALIVLMCIVWYGSAILMNLEICSNDCMTSIRMNKTKRKNKGRKTVH